MWLWEKHPGPVPGTQTKWASFEASAIVLATREMFPRVCSRKIMDRSHASDLLGTTKVRIPLWSSLNRCLAQSIQRGYNWCGKAHKHHQSSPPSTGCPLWLRVVQQVGKLNQHAPAYHPLDTHDDFQWQFLLSKAASSSGLPTRCPLWLSCRWTSTRVSIWVHRGNPFCKK